MNWERFPKQFNAQRAQDTYQKDYFIAPVVYVLCLRQNRKEILRLDLRYMSVPFYTVREDDTRGTKDGQSRWQYDHLEGKRRNKRAAEEKYRSILHRWQEEEAYRDSKSARGWTEEYCTWTILELMTYHTTQHGKRDQDMKTCG